MKCNRFFWDTGCHKRIQVKYTAKRGVEIAEMILGTCSKIGKAIRSKADGHFPIFLRGEIESGFHLSKNYYICNL